LNTGAKRGEAIKAVCDLADKAGCTFSAEQRIILAGSLSVWLEKAYVDGVKDMAVQAVNIARSGGI
jgi:hypothetical protein